MVAPPQAWWPLRASCADCDDVATSSHDAFVKKRAARTHDDDDDVCPASGSDRGSMASPATPCTPAALIIDDDDDVSPTSGGGGQLITPTVQRLTKRAAYAFHDDDDVCPASGGDRGSMNQMQAVLAAAQEQLRMAELELAMCEADERAMDAALSESTVPSRQGSTLPPGVHRPRGGKPCEALLRARRHLGAEKARRQTASAAAMGRMQAATVHLDTATAQLSEADAELVAAAQVEQELADASASAWAQMHLARVRVARQRAEAEARAKEQRAKEEVRLQQARARLEEAQERLKQSELELAVCEVDERALDALLSELSEPEPTEAEPTSTNAQASSEGGEVMAPPVRTQYGSSSTAADVDDEISFDADDVGVGLSKRVADARRRLAAEQARREAALAQTETQRETALEAARARLQLATAQLAEIAAEATVAAQEEKKAAETVANAWSQVHIAHVRTGTAAQRAAVEANAARQRAEEEARLRHAKAKLAEVQKRLRQTERQLALCKAEERALNKPIIRDTLFECKRLPPVTWNLTSATSEDVVVEIENVGRISTNSPGETPDQHAPEPEQGKMSSRSEAKRAKRVERLQRARRQLDAERARGREAALAGARARHEDAPAASMARVEKATAQLTEAEVEAAAPAQPETGAVEVSESALITSGTASVSLSLARTWDGGSERHVGVRKQSWAALAAPTHPPKGAGRTSLSLVSRRRVVVDPSSASCTQPPDRRVSSRVKSAAQFQAQHWLSTALTQAENSKDDTTTN
jgi:hypothetical protein